MLASLSVRFGDIVWEVMGGELRMVSQMRGVERAVPGWVPRRHFLMCDDEVMEEETSERTVDVEDEGDHAGE